MLDRLKKLSMAAAMMVLVAVLAEVLLRTFAPIYLVGSTAWYQYDEELGVLVRPSMHSLRLTDSLNEMRTNALGTINYQEDFEPYEALVFAAGDSYTQGIGVPSDVSPVRQDRGGCADRQDPRALGAVPPIWLLQYL
jgi:hypothetical protein